jgi:glycerophosphoryl diester phosphodiesterase
LKLVDGKIPLLVEIKENPGDSSVSLAASEMLKNYKGEYIVESFNPMTVRRMKKLRPDVLCGILSTTYTKDEKHKGKILYYLGEKLLLNFYTRPNFISYYHEGYTVRNLGFIRRVFGTPLFTWTVKSQAEENAAYEHGFDTVIFEGYIPKR